MINGYITLASSPLIGQGDNLYGVYRIVLRGMTDDKGEFIKFVTHRRYFTDNDQLVHESGDYFSHFMDKDMQETYKKAMDGFLSRTLPCRGFCLNVDTITKFVELENAAESGLLGMAFTLVGTLESH